MTTKAEMMKAEQDVLQAVTEIGACGPTEVCRFLGSAGPDYRAVCAVMRMLAAKGELEHPCHGWYYAAGQEDQSPRNLPLHERRRRGELPHVKHQRNREVVQAYVDGSTLREIADRFDVTYQRVQQVWHDTATAEDRERVQENRRKVVEERAAADLQTSQSVRARREEERERRRQEILLAVRDWNELFGEPPSASDWDHAPSSIKRSPWRKERCDATGRDWPKTRAVTYFFGSWSSAIAVAGFRPREKKDPKAHFHYSGGRAGAERAPKTHCKHGHEMTGDNLRVDPRGCRVCRTCIHNNAMRYRAKKGVPVGTGVKRKDGPTAKVVEILDGAGRPMRPREILEAAQLNSFNLSKESIKNAIANMKRAEYLSKVEGGYVLVTRPRRPLQLDTNTEEGS